MAGRVFFKQGARHPSRHAHCFEVPANLRPALERLTEKHIPRQEFLFLARAIAIARADNEIQTKERATRKDTLAQLKAMLRLKDDDGLLHALRGCDRMTYEAVQQAQIDAISDALWRDGVFVDAGGVEHRIAPSMELGAERVPPYLPMGFEGVRNAVAAALKSLEADEVREEAAPDLHLVTLRTAVKAWAKLKPDAELLPKIMEAVERQANSPQWRKDGGAFIPHPASWLHGRRWEDADGGGETAEIGGIGRRMFA
jgi:hypothetical protein